MHHLQFGGYVLLLVSQEYANTQFQFVEPQWGANPGPQLGWCQALAMELQSGSVQRGSGEGNHGLHSEFRRARCSLKI